MRLVDYNEIKKMFDEEYKRKAQLIREGETHLDNLAEGFVGADKVIWSLPDVDAVEVVRCKDCNNSADVACGVLYCCHFNKNVEENDYCSNGC